MELLDQFKFTLEVAWDNARHEASGHIILIVGGAAILVLLFIFLSPGVKRKGY